MKSNAFLSLLCLALQVTDAAPSSKKALNWQTMDKRQGKLGEAICIPPGGRVPDVPGAAPRRQEQKINEPSLPGVKRVKMRYGPYNVPNMMTKSVMGEGGALWNCGDANIEKPCVECTIVGQVAGLEYPNGTDANIDSGMWMHHMVALNVGPGRWDPTCYDNMDSLPHVGIGSNPRESERFFSSGNERTPMSQINQAEFRNGSVKKAGYHVNKEDTFRFIVDLMNMNMKDVIVYLTITYDLVDGPLPQGWSDLKPVWFDIDQCGMSDVHPAKEEGAFTMNAKPWTPNFSGDIVGLGAHLHDGGANVKVIEGQSKNVCTSEAKYAESPKYIFKEYAKQMEGGEKVAEKHISSMSTCYYDRLGVRKLEKSQSWSMEANYDYSKYTGNREAEGHQASIMGIAIMYVAVPAEGVKAPTV